MTFRMEVSLGLPFMKELTEGQCQMNERGRRAWIIFLRAHTSRGEKMKLFDRARINVVRGTGGTHHGPARLVPPRRLTRVMLRFTNRKIIT